MIVDCHCHAGLGDGLTGPWDTEAHLGRYLARATRAGIERTVVFSTFHSDCAVANRQVAWRALVRTNPLVTMALARSPAVLEEGLVRDAPAVTAPVENRPHARRVSRRVRTGSFLRPRSDDALRKRGATKWSRTGRR